MLLLTERRKMIVDLLIVTLDVREDEEDLG